MSEEQVKVLETPIDKSSEAMKILEEEMQRKRKEFQGKLIALLNEYGYQFDITTVIRGNGQIGHQIDFIPQQRQHQPKQ